MTRDARPHLAALFPGQGSQYPGMVKDLRDHFPWTKDLFEEASDAIKFNLFKLCLEGPESDLQLTVNAQPAILTTSYAWFQVLSRTLDFKPHCGAGHSLGEYSALASAGALSLTHAVKLVRKRGEMMQTAVPAGVGKMAAVIGMDDEKIKALCEAATEGDYSIVVPANFNAPGQVVIAGHAEAVDRAQVIGAGNDPKYPGLKARKIIPLKVSAPFHCPLMKPVAEKFVQYLEAVSWKEPAFAVASNLDGKLRQSNQLVGPLKDQIDNPVLWTQCVRDLHNAGASHFIEVGPGKVLTALVKRIVDEPKTFTVDSVDDVKALEKYWEENFK